MKIILLTILLTLALWSGGCNGTPVQQASELRGLYTEAQTQIAEAKTDKTLDQAKVTAFEAKLNAAGPWIDKIETTAAASQTDAGQAISFGTLIAIWKPQVESILIGLVIRRYLGG